MAFERKVYSNLQEKGLRIAWQYKKYFGEHNSEAQRGIHNDYFMNENKLTLWI